MELTILQIILIASLLFIIPLGYANQIRMKRKKKRDEELYANYQSSESSQDSLSYSNQSMIDYITQYKSQFSRDQIKQSLIRAGNSEEEINRYLDKFF